MSLARNIMEDTTKVSLRISGRNHNKDLRIIVDSIAQGMEGAQAGGHKAAAGAIIPTNKEDEF